MYHVDFSVRNQWYAPSMPGKSKIEKYKLEARCENLAFDLGKTVDEIAEILTSDLAGRDTITKSSVARYLQPRRDQIRDQIQTRLNEHAQEKLETDLECIEEIQLFLINEMRNQEAHSVKDRSEYGMKAARVIDMKLARSLGDPTGGGGSGFDPVDLDEFRNDLDRVKEQAAGEGTVH